MEDQVTYQTLTKGVSDQAQVENEMQNLRNELLSLAEKHEIKQSVAYIKAISKASHRALEKIKTEYERKQLEETTYPKQSWVRGGPFDF